MSYRRSTHYSPAGFRLRNWHTDFLLNHRPATDRKIDHLEAGLLNDMPRAFYILQSIMYIPEGRDKSRWVATMMYRKGVRPKYKANGTIGVCLNLVRDQTFLRTLGYLMS